MNRFKHGDEVRWTSQSSGTVKEKRGRIVCVVNAGQHVGNLVYTACGHYDAKSEWGCGLCRGHESYLVLTVDGNRRRIYWPRVSALKLEETQ